MKVWCNTQPGQAGIEDRRFVVSLLACVASFAKYARSVFSIKINRSTKRLSTGRIA
jgi:hypothetical protein